MSFFPSVLYHNDCRMVIGKLDVAGLGPIPNDKVFVLVSGTTNWVLLLPCEVFVMKEGDMTWWYMQ